MLTHAGTRSPKPLFIAGGAPTLGQAFSTVLWRGASGGCLPPVIARSSIGSDGGR